MIWSTGETVIGRRKPTFSKETLDQVTFLPTNSTWITVTELGYPWWEANDSSLSHGLATTLFSPI
jgi:hypothetical protein